MTRKLFAILIGCYMVEVSPAYGAYGMWPEERANGYQWKYSSGEIVYRKDVYGYFCAVSPEPTGAVTIPSTLGGVPVTGIGEKAFSYCRGMTSVKIPDSVKTIGKEAFVGCTGLTSITIPKSVTSISSEAFHHCSGLESIFVEQGNTQYKIQVSQWLVVKQRW